MTAEPEIRDVKPPIVGVGGWLILPILGFAGTLVLTGYNLFLGISNWEGIKFIFANESGQFGSLRVALVLSTVVGIAILVSAAICLYRIFVAKNSVRKFAVAHYSILAVGGFTELWADRALSSALPEVASDPTLIKESLRGIVIASIWIPYFMVSKRVANTFESPTAIASNVSKGVR
jgi:Protein of unknown function (DUF2569)